MYRRARERALNRLMLCVAGPLAQVMTDGEAASEDKSFVDQFHNLDRDSLLDLISLEPDADVSMHDLAELMDIHCSPLRLIFKAYACMGVQPSIIARDDWKRLAVDIQVCGGTNLPLAQIDIIYVRATRTAAQSAGTKGSAPPGLVPAKFLEALVRLAHAKFRGPDAGAAAGKKADKRKKRKGSKDSPSKNPKF